MLNAASLGREAAWIGTQAKLENRKDRFFHGAIDEVGVWGRALTEEEVGQLYRMGEEGESLSRQE